MVRENTSDMICMHNQQGGDHNPYYTPTTMGMITGGGSSMEMAVVHSLYDVLHEAVFHIISMSTQVKNKNF